MLSRNLRWALALSALVLGSSAAMAQSSTGFYVFGTVGFADQEAKLGDFNTAYGLAIPPTFDTAGLSESASAFKIGAGYRATRNLAVEASYGWLGKMTYAVIRPGVGTFQSSIEPEAAQLAVLGIIPFSPAVEAFGKLGVAYINNRGNIGQASAFGPFPGCTGPIVCLQGEPTDTWAGVLGVGLNYNFGRIFVRGEFEYYPSYKVASAPDLRPTFGPAAQAGGDVKIETMTISIGLGYRF